MIISIRGRALAATLMCVVLAACSPDGSTSAAGGFATGSSTSPAPPPCSTTYRRPDPQRPQMTLHFTLAPDHRLVTGTEKVVFRPDRQVSQLVFRLTANSPSVSKGTSTEIRTATADHGGGRFTVTKANATKGTQGGLLRIPFSAPVAAGTAITARIAFRLTLGTGGFDRFGRSGPFAFFGSGEPLLAWQRGYGWHTEDLTDQSAETATSEAMDVELSVDAPVRDTVIMSGDPSTPGPQHAGARTWQAHIPTARDVSVAAGPFAVADATVHGVRLRVGAPTKGRARALIDTYTRAMTQLAARFGPYPFASLSVARFSDTGGGIEYPSSILAFNSSFSLAAHETAHQWFYALVGNSQARHPWLDEAFATYAEGLLDGDPVDASYLREDGKVDSAVSAFPPGSYVLTVYLKGASAPFAARKAAGAHAFDAALRCYVAANAWRIAVPANVSRALAGLPAALRILRKAGAIR